MNRIARIGMVILLAAACRQTTEPIPVNAIVGTWGVLRAPNDPPGSGESLTLAILPALPPGNTANEAQLRGEGSWHGEAGPSGTSTATGWVRSDSVTLDITYVFDAQFGGGTARIGHFAGRLTDVGTMAGTISFANGVTGTVTYRKFGPD